VAELTATLTDAQEAFLKEGHLAVVATLRDDGSPQLTPTWIDAENGKVLFNTAEGRAKPKNLRRDTRCSVCVVDRKNPYRWLSITGSAELEHKGAEEHIDVLAHRYTGEESYDVGPDEERVIVRVAPERVHGSQIE
jgi:PPOX class probable F420-dependent enzyme